MITTPDLSMKLQFTLCLMLAVLCAFAQGNNPVERVSFGYKNTRLKSALNDLSKRYDLRFSYSSDQIDVRQRITASANDLPLDEGLRTLFRHTGIGYRYVGGHIILKPDPGNTRIEVPKKKKERKEMPPPPDEGLASIEEPPLPKRDTIDVSEVALSPLPEVSRVQGTMFPIDEKALRLQQLKYEAHWLLDNRSNHSRVQVSLVPFVGTNGLRSDEVINNASLNLLWGMNGGVEGAEIGGFLNSLRGNMKGFQAAGLGNIVEGNTTGSQVAGLFNMTLKTARGVQAAGLLNFAGNAQTMQLAGLFNWSENDASRMQLAGFFNRVRNDAHALQFAGLANLNGGDANTQLSGLMNVAEDVSGAQVSALYNKAAEVKGIQVALVNASDTMSGVSIGLLNFVKKGYNKFDLYAGEGLHFNTQLKLGSHHFYNVFYAGARYPDGDGSYLWGFGYGFGTALRTGRKSELNLELMAIHLNESEPLTNKLNSMGQLRMSWNHWLGRHIGFFFGPTLNVFASQRLNPDTGRAGDSEAVPYTIIETTTKDDTAIKGWVGVNAGFRF